MEWTSQDDIEGECAPTQLVPASQACDIAEESALEFNPDQSQDAWGAPESLDAWSAPSPVSRRLALLLGASSLGLGGRAPINQFTFNKKQHLYAPSIGYVAEHCIGGKAPYNPR